LGIFRDSGGLSVFQEAYIRLRVMPYTFGDSTQCASALIPCQACGLDKIKQVEPKFDLFYFGDPYGNLNPNVRCHAAGIESWQDRTLLQPCGLRGFHS
jgi:hypothetical protein